MGAQPPTPAGPEDPRYALVDTFSPVVMRVMIGCLGQKQPTGFSRLFCPLIFLALHPQHSEYQHVSSAAYSSAMDFWQERFSRWVEWVAAIRRIFPRAHEASAVITCDSSAPVNLLFGVTSSPLIPHYTANAQEDVLSRAGIDAEVNACAQMTFRGQTHATSVPPMAPAPYPALSPVRPWSRRSTRSPRSPRIHPGSGDVPTIQPIVPEVQIEDVQILQSYA